MTSEARAMRRPRWFGDILTVGIWMAVGLAVFGFWEIDLLVQRLLFGSIDDPWPLGAVAPWPWLRKVTPLPALLTGAAAVVYLAWDVLRRQAGRYRLHALYLVLALLIGPGLVVNSTFKMNWGRPRPRQIREFGGWLEYRAPHQPGTRGRGVSFPSGHVSVGAYFSAFYLLLRRRRKRWARWVLAGSMVYTGVIGAGRMMEGAHYLSDVAWAGLMVYLCNVLLYYGLDIPGTDAGRHGPARVSRVRRGPAIIAGLVVLAAAGVVALVSTGHHTRRLWMFEGRPGERTALLVEGSRGAAIVRFVRAERVTIETEAIGFGWPWSGMVAEAEEDSDAEGRWLRAVFGAHGWFSDLDLVCRIDLPVAGLTTVTLRVVEGDVMIGAPPPGTGPELIIEQRGGTLRLDPGWRERSPRLRTENVRLAYE